MFAKPARTVPGGVLGNRMRAKPEGFGGNVVSTFQPHPTAHSGDRVNQKSDAGHNRDESAVSKLGRCFAFRPFGFASHENFIQA